MNQQDLIRTNPENGVCRYGETICFTLDKTAENLPYELTWNRMELLQKGTLTPGGKIEVKTEKAGFFLLRTGEKEPFFEAAAAVEPERIQAVTPEPADFDEFWRKQLARLKTVP